MEHFPHAGTQQMNGLMAPAVAQSVPAMAEPFQGFQADGQGFQADGQGFQDDGLEPLQPMGNIVTSGFETHLNHQRSGSGSQVAASRLHIPIILHTALY